LDEEAVHLLDLQTGVGDGVGGGFQVKAQRGTTGHLALRRVADAHDSGLIL
jgi:hypothetical protein